MSEQPFFVPSYYKNFRCKGGECRRSCCGGWPISVSMEEYFRLIGMECSPDLRHRLDCAFRVAEEPDEGCYARICPNYVGDCPMHREDGLCGLQWEGGEAVLPDVCRLFPRAVHSFGRSFCVCSSACEHTVELLIADEEPLRLEEMPLAPFYRRHSREVPYSAEREELRHFCLETVADRTLPFSRRIDRIAARLHGDSGVGAFASLNEETVFAIQVALATHYATHSESVGDACQQALAALPTPAAFGAALASLTTRFPSLWIWMEKILVNYMLQECFPYTGRERESHHEGLALCGVCAFCLFLLAGCQPKDEAAFVDLVSAAFRLIGHTAFDHNVLVLIHRQLPNLL